MVSKRTLAGTSVFDAANDRKILERLSKVLKGSRSNKFKYVNTPNSVHIKTKVTFFCEHKFFQRLSYFLRSTLIGSILATQFLGVQPVRVENF